MRISSKRILNQRRAAWCRPPVAASRWAWASLGGLGIVLVSWLVYDPASLLITGAVMVCLAVVGGVSWKYKFDRMTRERAGESICQFARFFRKGEVDPVIVRAVYESVQDWLPHPALPIRPSDDFAKTYGIHDALDVEDLASEVAELTCRSLQKAEQNPFYGRVNTVADLVYFIQHQPRLLA